MSFTNIARMNQKRCELSVKAPKTLWRSPDSLAEIRGGLRPPGTIVKRKGRRGLGSKGNGKGNEKREIGDDTAPDLYSYRSRM